MNHLSYKKYLYHWEGSNEQGKKVSGEISAFSINLATLNLVRKGIQLSAIHKKNPFAVYFNRRISPSDIMLFFRQLATLIAANIPITHAIHILNQNAEHVQLMNVINSLQEDIATGKEFSRGLQKFPHYFDEITCQLIASGEKTGTLDIILERIAQQKEKNYLLKSKIKQALFYPGMVILVTLITTIIMLTCVVPRFADLYHSLHSELPAFTRAVIFSSDLLRSHFSFLGLILMSAIGAAIYSRKLSRVKISVDWCLLNCPVISPLLKKVILARFTRHLATIFAAGIPVAEALNMICLTTGNYFYTQAIQKIHLSIVTGKQLHAAIATHPLFPPMTVQLIQIGEESGTLEKMLVKIADFYEADIDRLVTNLSKLLEPLIMVILGVLIGGLVIAMYLPIFKLGTII